jgi:hypothetical protein
MPQARGGLLTGRARFWWTVASVIQFWRHIECLLLFIQAQAGVLFFGTKVSTSYNSVVLALAAVAPTGTTVVLALISTERRSGTRGPPPRGDGRQRPGRRGHPGD